MKSLFVCLLLITGLALKAQDSTVAIVVHKDPRLDLLQQKQVEINTAIRKSNARTARGFRLLVANTSSREEAMAAKTKVYANFPELKAYLIYQAPSFKLKVGNFRTREEAVQYQKTLAIYFPKGLQIISDTIEVVPEK